MTVASASGPFAADTYRLAEGVRLTRMTPGEALLAGALCAAIEPWLSYPFELTELTAFFAEHEPQAPRFTLHVEERFAGALVVRLNWMRGPYVHMLAVAPEYQGRGLGTAVLSFVEGEAHRGGARNLWIAATDSNAGARRIYRRFGFVEAATLDGLVRDDRTEILMRKKLAISQ